MLPNFRYDESEIFLSTFCASFGYCNKLSAFDMVYSVEALLENNVISLSTPLMIVSVYDLIKSFIVFSFFIKDAVKNKSDKFIEALNCLNRDNLKSLEMGIEMAKTHCKLVFQQIQNFVDMNQIVASGPFLQVFLEEVCKINQINLKSLRVDLECIEYI